MTQTAEEEGLQQTELEGMHTEGDEGLRQTKEEKPKGPGVLGHIFSWRTVMYGLLHFTLTAWCIPRSATSMAFVCINSKREEILRRLNASGLDFNLGQGQGQGDDGQGDNSTYSNTSSQSILEEYDYVLNDINWGAGTKGLVLAGPMMLAFAGPLVFDVIIQRTGSKSVFALTQLANAVLMFSSPSLARDSPYLLLVNHILLGLTVNACAPVISTLLPRWTPSKHNLTVAAIVYSGVTAGPMVLNVLNGYLCSVPIDNGWPFIYYTAGAIHAIYGLAWFFLMEEFPETHRFISDKEEKYIVSRRPQLSNHNDSQKKNNRPPYCAILTSIPVLTFMFVMTCFLWTLTVMIVYIPIYLNSVHQFSAEDTGLAFSFICAVRIFGTYFWTSLGNNLTKREILTLPATRKVCICVGMLLAAVACFAVAFFDRDNRWVAIAFITLGLFAKAVAISHLNIIAVDLAPRYAGTVFSIAASPSLLVSASGPLIVAALTPTGSFEEWRMVWYIMAALSLASCLAFLLFGQASIQPWAAAKPKEEPQENELLEA